MSDSHALQLGKTIPPKSRMDSHDDSAQNVNKCQEFSPQGGRNLRIAMLPELYFPNIGGQEVFFQELAETLVRRGHSVDVYTIGPKPGLAAIEEIHGVTVRRVPNTGNYLQPAIPMLRRNWGDIFKYSAAVRRIAKIETYDFFLLNQWPLLHALALPRQVRKRSGIHFCEIRKHPVLRAAQKWLPRSVDTAFSVSEAVGKAIEAQSGRSCVLLPSGIDRWRYAAAPRTARSGVLYLGRVASHKNLPLLVDAYELAVAKGLKGDLIIAGDGPAREDVENHIRRSSVAAQIKVLGSVGEDQKIELLSTASVFVMPSMREGFPRVIAEAMASGLPIVTGDFDGNGSKEVVSQYGSGVVCGTQAADFADALLGVEPNWGTYSNAGLAAAKSLDWSHIADRFEMCVWNVAAKRTEMRRRG